MLSLCTLLVALFYTVYNLTNFDYIRGNSTSNNDGGNSGGGNSSGRDNGGGNNGGGGGPQGPNDPL